MIPTPGDGYRRAGGRRRGSWEGLGGGRRTIPCTHRLQAETDGMQYRLLNVRAMAVRVTQAQVAIPISNTKRVRDAEDRRQGGGASWSDSPHRNRSENKTTPMRKAHPCLNRT